MNSYISYTTMGRYNLKMMEVNLKLYKHRNNYFNEFIDHFVGKKEREAHRACRDMKLLWVYYILRW